MAEKYMEKKTGKKISTGSKWSPQVQEISEFLEFAWMFQEVSIRLVSGL